MGGGVLLAIPLHFGSRTENRTVFIDTMQPHDDQWGVPKTAKNI